MLRPALEALFRMAVRAIWEGGKISPASVMDAWVRKSSAVFLSDSGFSRVGYLVWEGTKMIFLIIFTLVSLCLWVHTVLQGLMYLIWRVHVPWGRWADPPWVCRGCGPPGGSWAAGWAAARILGSAPEPSPGLPGSPAEGYPQTGCWTRWTHPLYRRGTHTSTWNRKVTLNRLYAPYRCLQTAKSKFLS